MSESAARLGPFAEQLPDRRNSWLPAQQPKLIVRPLRSASRQPATKAAFVSLFLSSRESLSGCHSAARSGSRLEVCHLLQSRSGARLLAGAPSTWPAAAHSSEVGYLRKLSEHATSGRKCVQFGPANYVARLFSELPNGIIAAQSNKWAGQWSGPRRAAETRATREGHLSANSSSRRAEYQNSRPAATSVWPRGSCRNRIRPRPLGSDLRAYVGLPSLVKGRPEQQVSVRRSHAAATY